MIRLLNMILVDHLNVADDPDVLVEDRIRHMGASADRQGHPSPVGLSVRLPARPAIAGRGRFRVAVEKVEQRAPRMGTSTETQKDLTADMKRTLCVWGVRVVIDWQEKSLINGSCKLPLDLLCPGRRFRQPTSLKIVTLRRFAEVSTGHEGFGIRR